MSKNQGLMKYVKVGLAGFAMGVANVIPGVSGGTMAFILGVFEELVSSIKEIASMDTLKMLMKFEFKRMWNELPIKFLLALFVGVGVALASASSLFIYLLENYQSMTYAAFFGLILASIVCMFKEVNKWNIVAIVSLVLGALFAGWLVSMVPATTENVWYLSLGSGVVVICAMILPGISGSFLLLLFGQYNYVWGAVAKCAKLDFSFSDICTIFWTGIGALIGLAAFIHFLNFLLNRFRNATMATLIGFMVGSLWRLWPWQDTLKWSVKSENSKTIVDTLAEAQAIGSDIEQAVVKNVLPTNFDANFWYTVLLLIGGIIVVFAIELIVKKKETE